MLQRQKSGKFTNEKRRYNHNILNNNRLQTLLITRVFATNFDVGGLYASYERHFVKKIQHLLSFRAICQLNAEKEEINSLAH